MLGPALQTVSHRWAASHVCWDRAHASSPNRRVFFIFIWSIPTKAMHIGKKSTLLHSPEFFGLYHRHMELSQKIYASS